MVVQSPCFLKAYIIFFISLVLLVFRSPALGDVDFTEGIDNEQVIGDIINSTASLFASDIILSSQLIGALDSSESDLEKGGYSAVPAISYIDDPFVWYRFEEKEYLTDAKAASDIHDAIDTAGAAVSNGDSHPDVAIESLNLDEIAWPDIDARGIFGKRPIFSTDINRKKEISAAEFDSNADMGVRATISGLPYEVVWYPNDETDNFQIKLFLLIDPEDSQSLRAVRLDDDGTLDIGRTDPGSIKQQIVWDKNIADHDELWFEALISSIECFTPPAFETVDLNNNGCQSMATACEIGDMIVWYPAQSNVKFKSKEIIASNVEKPRLLYVAGLDVVSDFGGDNDNVWNEYEIESNGRSGSPQFYFDKLNTIQSFLAADLDIVSAPLNAHKIAWFKNQLIPPLFRNKDRFSDDIDN